MPLIPNPPPIVSLIPTSTLEQLQQRFKQDPVLGVIQKNLSDAFTQASLQERKDYCAALLTSRQAKEELKQVFKPLMGISAFAEPLLSKALDARFGPGLDVRKDTLFYPTLTDSGATGSATQLTLLESALHSFERKESVTGFFLSSAAILDSKDDVQSKGIKPEQFADLCRHLNLGRKYLDHLQSVLEPDSAPGDAPDAARFNARAKFIANDKADMEVCARAAAMKKTIGQAACSAVIALARQQPEPQFDGHLMWLKCLTMFGVEIQRALLITPQRTWTTTQVPILLYIPQDPVNPLKEYGSMTELEDDLRTRLMDKSYQAFFAQLIGERNRAAFFTRLNTHLFPLAPIDGDMFTQGLWHHAADPKANLVLDTEVIKEAPFSRMHRQQLFLLKDNARFLAVPTEEEDAKSRQERLDYWLGVGMNILNLASFVIPPLAAAMMVYSTVELIGEVYHGLQDLSHGDMEEGLDHLLDAAGQIAFMALLVAGHQVPEPPPIKSNNFVGKVIPITLNNGETRLWKPDLTPFQSRTVLPEGASPDVDGVVEHDGKKYLTIDDQRYEVQYHESLNKWVIKHPNGNHPFSPALEHNGVGAFWHEGEVPQQWAKDKLFKRLGHSVSGLSDTAAEQILAVVDVDESLLRRVHMESTVPPGQLRDTVKRFQLDAILETSIEEPGSTRSERFEQLYNASEVSTDPLAQLIRRDFPTIPAAVAEDLVATLTSAEQQLMLETGRIPLRVGEAAAWQQRQTRLNRAIEGFYLKSVANPDTEILSLHLLEKLPGWSDQVRLEIRQGTDRGSLLDSIGNPHASELKILVKSNGRYQAFDADGNELNSVSKDGNNLCASVLHALPDEPRRAIGLPHVAQGPELNATLATLAAGDREQASRILGIRNGRLKFNVPKRMKQGRLGYPLSGTGKLAGFISDDHLLDRIGLLELDTVTAPEVLMGMRNEGLSNGDINARLDVLQEEHQALRVSLDQWTLASSALPEVSAARAVSRTRMAEAIMHHWQASSVFVVGEAPVAFRLERVALGDFPAQLPDFFYSRIERLELFDTVRNLHQPPLSEWNGVEQTLERFLSRFAHITSLDVSRPVATGYRAPGYSELPRIVSTSLPRLRTLNLINQDLVIGSMSLEALNGLQDLERLDLSGNSLELSNEMTQFPIHRDLQRLGLDRTGINWPFWLNDRLPGRIGELSLNDNPISAMPDRIVSNQLDSSDRTLISLQRNQLSRAALIEIRLGEARTGSSFSYHLDVPVELQAQMNVLLQEQAELESALRDWTDASGSSAPLDEDMMLSRRETSAMLINHWGRAVSGRAPLAVLVESSPLADFPQFLPETFYRTVSSLSLQEVTVDVEQLNGFLRRFQQITSLELIELSPRLVTPPSALAELPNLLELDLINQGMMIDQNAMDFFARLPRVQHLNLSGNQLGPITDTSVLVRHYWRSLMLDNAGIQSWPEWLTELVPANINSLSLNRNQITELPAEILENPRSDWAHTEISLEGNPLSRESMIVAHARDHGSYRSFSFYMDLPVDIQVMPVDSTESGGSDSDTDSEPDSDAPVHRHGRVGAGIGGRPVVEPWLVGTVEEIADHRVVWEQLETAADAPALLALVNRLRESADFLRARDALTPRVWYVLEAAANDPELRGLLNGMAQDEDIANPTCADGVRLEFNQMEVQVFTRRSLRDIPDAERGQTLYGLMRRLYRLSEVDRLAVANTRGRDQAEVRLAYRLGLAERLDLPLPPSSMLYRNVAGVNADEQATVQGEVMANESGPGLLDYAANRDFWTDWLRETYAPQFAELQETFDQKRSRLEDDFPELNDEYLERAKRLLEQKEEKDRNLIRQLTNKAGLKYD